VVVAVLVIALASSLHSLSSLRPPFLGLNRASDIENVRKIYAIAFSHILITFDSLKAFAVFLDAADLFAETRF
jgi:hypothetical protein